MINENTQNQEQVFNSESDEFMQETENTETDNKFITDEITEQFQETEKQFYTTDEMRSLDWAQVNTSRIPPEQLPFYKSMQASFTKKRQAQADELRKLATSTNLPKKENLDINEHMQALKQAQAIVKTQMPESDEFDPTYNVAVQSVAMDIVSNNRKVKENMSKFNALLGQTSAKYGEKFHEVDKLAQNIMDNEYPASISRQVMEAASVGNYAPINAIMEEAHRRVTGALTSPSITQRTKITPPNALGAGSKTKGTVDDTKRLFGI